MKVVETIGAVRAARPAGSTRGFVPTMGFLHAGHMALVQRARAENAQVAVSIFVNPTQFGPHEDLARYPRDLRRDLEMLEAAAVDLVFVPTVEEMYPPGFDTYIDVGSVSAPLEGARRPGHFRGVATVVCKLLHVMEPERVYFGQKDAQQTVVIRKMVRDLAIDSEIIVVPTVREADGLALSSRNVYLTPDERAAAPVLLRALTAGQQQFLAGERSGDRLRAVVEQVIDSSRHAAIDYVSIADPHTLQELERVEDAALASLAVRFGTTRLIDNQLWHSPEGHDADAAMERGSR
ncbi:MAG: pantoate--beta-alanine ligase [Herpetosiphon sp.]